MMVDGYRVAGTTDDVTTCDQCGREDLRMTVRLVIVKGDVEDGELFVGSECATRFPAPGRKRRTRSAILAEAAAADRERIARREQARKMLDYLLPDGPDTEFIRTAKLYVSANERWAQQYVAGGGDLLAYVRRRVAELQAEAAE